MRAPDTFSGGYQLRLHLARALLAEPDVLLLDEPTNYLDIVAIRWLTQFLKQWKGSLVTISHDRHFLDAISTHTIGIFRQQVKKVEGTTETFYSQMAIEEEAHEKTRQNLEKRESVPRTLSVALEQKQPKQRRRVLDKK